MINLSKMGRILSIDQMDFKLTPAEAKVWDFNPYPGFWWPRWDSNPGHFGYEPSTLNAELQGQIKSASLIVACWSI